MIRILHIARYNSPMMERKIDVMALESDLSFFRVRPSEFRDLTGQTPEGRTIPLIGNPTHPHRAIYRTLSFALRSVRPHIIDAEEEPDSLSAFQILLAKRCFAPRSLLLLHAWQNIDRPATRLARMVVRATFRDSAAILYASSEASRLLSRMGYTGLTDVIPPQGVDTRIFKPVERGAPLSDRLTVMYAGRFVREKGLDTLFDALNLVRNPVHLLLVGSGPDTEGLGNRVRALKRPHSAEIVAPCEQIDMVRFYSRADIFVLPSRSTARWREQSGRALVEAMACGVPVIGSNSGAIPEIIGPDGLIFREGDREGLASCLTSLTQSGALRVSLANRGYRRVTTTFSQERLAARTALFYREMIRKTVPDGSPYKGGAWTEDRGTGDRTHGVDRGPGRGAMEDIL
jgi:L-malate glycosyltransferase